SASSSGRITERCRRRAATLSELPSPERPWCVAPAGLTRAWSDLARESSDVSASTTSARGVLDDSLMALLSSLSASHGFLRTSEAEALNEDRKSVTLERAHH